MAWHMPAGLPTRVSMKMLTRTPESTAACTFYARANQSPQLKDTAEPEDMPRDEAPTIFPYHLV